MTGRLLAQTLVTVVLTVLMLLLTAGLIGLATGASAAEAFLDDGPRQVFGTLWIALILWTILLPAAGMLARKRARRWRIGLAILVTVLVALLNLMLFTGIALTAGGWGMLLVGIAAVSAAMFLVLGCLAILLTQLMLLPGR